MYLLTVLAFAFILWLPDDLPIRPPVQSAASILLLIGLQQAVLAGLGLFAGLLAIRKLNAAPNDPQQAQHVYARSGLILRWLLVTSFIVLCLCTDWVGVVKRSWPLGGIFGAADLVVLLPFLIGAVMVWIGLYPGEQAIRQVGMASRLRLGGRVRPLWSLGGYLVFHLRNQLLVVALPMTVVLVAYDTIDFYGPWLMASTGMRWVREVLLGAAAGVVFLFAPLVLRCIWSTARLPDGPLREQLEAVSERAGLRYRELLIWRSEGILVNAAVIGLLSPLRYVILSDGLLETMKDEEIKAVFGHEVGHMKLRHMEFFLLFALLSVFLVGGIVELVRYVSRPEEWVIDTLGFLLIVLAWGVGFGWISRRFERQADAFGARCLGQDVAECRLACVVHGTGDSESQEPRGVGSGPICSTAARIFTQALYRVAQLNGIPVNERSWRHSSIRSRAEFLQSVSADASRAERFDRLIRAVKGTLVVGVLGGLGGSIAFYWPLW